MGRLTRQIVEYFENGPGRAAADSPGMTAPATPRRKARSGYPGPGSTWSSAAAAGRCRCSPSSYTLSSDGAREWAGAFYALALVANYPHYMATVYRAYGATDRSAHRLYTVYAPPA